MYLEDFGVAPKSFKEEMIVFTLFWEVRPSWGGEILLEWNKLEVESQAGLVSILQMTSAGELKKFLWSRTEESTCEGPFPAVSLRPGVLIRWAGGVGASWVGMAGRARGWITVLKHRESTFYGLSNSSQPSCKVGPHVLVDGLDSVWFWGAILQTQLTWSRWRNSSHLFNSIHFHTNANQREKYWEEGACFFFVESRIW